MTDPTAPDDHTPAIPDEPGTGDAATMHWRQRAAFSLFVDAAAAADGHELRQTRLYHEETGDETTLNGFDQTALVRWLTQHIGAAPDHAEPRPAGGTERPDQRTTGRSHLLHVEILAVRVLDRLDARPGTGEQDVRVEARLRVAGSTQLLASLGAAIIGPVLELP